MVSAGIRRHLVSVSSIVYKPMPPNEYVIMMSNSANGRIGLQRLLIFFPTAKQNLVFYMVDIEAAFHAETWNM